MAYKQDDMADGFSNIYALVGGGSREDEKAKNSTGSMNNLSGGTIPGGEKVATRDQAQGTTSTANATSGTGPVAPPVTGEPVQGNSLDQIMRQITNLLSGTGSDTFNKGGSILDTGSGVFGKGIESFQPAVDYWSKLLSGDKKASTQAIAPTAGAISTQYDQASRTNAQNTALGGFRSVGMAEAPFKKAHDIGNLFNSLQPEAAKQLSAIAQQISQLGLGEQGVGLGEQGVGLQSIIASINALLSRRGQNVQETAALQGMIGQIAGAAGKLASAGIFGV